MKKIKVNEIMKIAMATILSIGLFSAAFVGVNNFAFAVATNNAERIPPVAVAVATPAVTTANKTESGSPTATTANKRESDSSAATTANKTESGSSFAVAVATPAVTTANKTESGSPAATTANKRESGSSATVAVATPAVTSNKRESDSPAAAATNTPAVEVATMEEYKKPDMTVYQKHNEWFTASANALSPEEAAELGAKYIWDVLGERIDGKTVEMYYSAHPSHTRAYWHGNVAEARENLDVTDMENYDVQFGFTICAVSGERIDISNTRRAKEAGMTNRMYKALWDEINKLNTEETEELVRLRDEYPPPERLEEYEQMARDFGARHFSNTEVIDSRLYQYNHFGDFDLDENGNIVIAPTWAILFTVTDSTGREADIGINKNTEELTHLLTQHNDIVPGYIYDGPPGVG